MAANESRKYYSDEDIERLEKMLDEKAEEGTKKLSKKEVILRLQPKIKRMLDQGFTLAEICAFFAEAGFPVSKPTVHAVIAGLNMSTKQKSKKEKSSEKSDKKSEKQPKADKQPEVKPEEKPEVKPEPKPTEGRFQTVDEDELFGK